MKALALLHSFEYVAAIRAFQRVFRQNPQHPGAAHYLAASNERAWPASRRAASSPVSSSWHALEWLQYAYLQLGRHTDASALIDTAHAIIRSAQLRAADSDARNVVSQLAFQYGWETGRWDRYPAGLPAIEDVLAQPRPTARAWGTTTTAAYQAAVAALRSRDDAGPARKVIATFRISAASMAADDTRRAGLQRHASQLEAMTLFAAGERERTVTLLQQLTPAEPNNASVPPRTIPSYELLGEYLLAMGINAEAAAAFEKALELRPNRAAAVRGLARAGSGGTAVLVGDRRRRHPHTRRTLCSGREPAVAQSTCS